MKILFGVLLVVALIFSAESKRTCSHDEYVEHMISKDPSIMQRWTEAEIQQERYLARSRAEKRADDDVYTIPVVVHIIYRVTGENIPEDRIIDQIARLNVDYRRVNDLSTTVNQFKDLPTDSRIQFVLATINPNGNATNGITRTQTAISTFPSPGDSGFDNDCQKSSTGGVDAWNTKKYMNIWVCNMGGNKLGFAQLPNGGPSTDGIVINTPAFGYFAPNAPYNLGRTLTHETGHWLNLRHPWGEDTGDCNEDDQVADTPFTNDESYQCNLTRVSCGVLTMVQNYMDYSDDNCMTLFTPLQVQRMRLQLGPAGFRNELGILNYNGTVIGTDGNYTSPLGPLGGTPPAPITDDQDSDNGLSIDDFKSGTYLYILIAVAACIGIALICGIIGGLRRRR